MTYDFSEAAIIGSGLVISTLQWIVLFNKRLVGWRSKSLLWVPLSLIAWVLLTTWRIPFNLPRYIESFLVGLVGGSIQWILLRTHFQRAYYWIIASAIGWTLPGLPISDSVTVEILQFLSLSTLISVVTGACLVVLLKLNGRKLDNIPEAAEADL